MRHRARTAALLLAGLIALAAGPSAPLAQSEKSSTARIEIAATPIPAFERREPELKRFGRLEFRGGLVLTSNHERFGGLSGIRVAADGAQFIAISDRGFWVRGRIVSDGNRPAGIADAEIAPMLAQDGRTLAAIGWYDTEALAGDGGTLYVGIERTHRIVHYDYGRRGLAARAVPLPAPAAIRSLPQNQGIEALVHVPKGLPLAGTLIAISERGLDAADNVQGFLIGGPAPGAFAIRRSNDFDITDATLTPGGDLLILERHFSFARGVGMRIRRLSLQEIKPGAVVDGPVLIEAGNSHEIDNMEGISAHRNGAGETILTIVSDDNFSRLQRTLLLRFALIDD
ncbi:MAG: esterase-like activity of phytase family protein [Bradyrhizobiaceae bacterium]|nr:esterase-like activity of phytase family protein [Bradyrhizobiaceae bacterium]